jgi:hypothetical protein
MSSRARSPRASSTTRPPADAEALSRAAFAADNIFHAARRGDADALDRFIHAGAWVVERAASEPPRLRVRVIGVPIGSVDECGRTAASYAALYGHDALADVRRRLARTGCVYLICVGYLGVRGRGQRQRPIVARS